MKKFLLVSIAALVTATSFASVSEAGWRHRHHHNGAYLAGGLALGLLLTAPRVVVTDGYSDCVTKKRVKYNRWGERVVTYTKRCY